MSMQFDLSCSTATPSSQIPYSHASNQVTACTKLACLAYACCGIVMFGRTAKPCGACEYRFVWKVMLFALRMLSAFDFAVALKLASSAIAISFHKDEYWIKMVTYCLQRYSMAYQ